jgi:Fe-S-cluster containining protein
MTTASSGSGALDCTRCGACCFNPPENVHEGYTKYVELAPGDVLWKRPELLRRHTVEEEGRVHLRLLADQRCSALAGSLGRRVRCTIYHVRPSPCRRVQAGAELCTKYRRGLGLEQAETRGAGTSGVVAAGTASGSVRRAGQSAADLGKFRAR